MDDRTKTDWPETWSIPGQPATPRKSRWRSILATILALIAMAGAAWWMIQRPTAPSRPARTNAAAPTPVRAAVIEKGDIDIALNALGTVTSLSMVTIRTQVSGQLTRIAFTERQAVKPGDLLAEIDPHPFEAVVAQMQGQLERD